MTEKMLAEIERCCTCDEPTGRAGRMDDSLYCTTCGKGPFCQSCFDIHAPLCARVATLEAQAARDAKVREAIGPYREADSAVTRAYNRYVASKGTSEEAVAEFDLNWTRGVFVGYERVLDDALDAALAARNGE